MTPSQLTQFLEFTIPNRLPVLVKGKPGIGKSDIVSKACDAAKAELIISHPVVSDPTDYKGLPFPGEDGEAHFLPYGELNKIIHAKGPTVYFLDDLGQAPASVQAACFPAGSTVMTEDGMKNIEDIQLNEYVIDGDGNKNKVIELFERESEGAVVITAVGVLPVTCTPEHPILVSSGRKKKYKKNEKSGRYDIDSIKIGTPEWMEASKIKPGDWVCVPVPKARFTTKTLEIEKKGQTTRIVELTVQLAKLIGYYVGDGWYTQHKAVQSIGFALDLKYPELHEELIDLIKSVFNCHVFKGLKEDNAVRISFHDAGFGEFLSRVAGNRSHNKRIPDFILYHKDINILTAFIQGYLATDGARLKSGNVVRGVQWGTVSRTLAHQLQLALSRYGTLAPIKYHARDGQIMVNPRNGKGYPVRASYVIQCSDKRVLDALGEPYDQKRDVCWSFQHDGKLWTRVKSVKKQKFEGKVYNLEVEKSHTYTVNNMVVHNCMQLILARRINGHKVSEHVCFIAATNRREDKAHVQGMLEPVKSRFASIVELEVKTDDWVEWAIINDMPTELISFVRFCPSILEEFEPTKDITNSPSPRTVTNAGKMQKAGLPKGMEFEAFKGAAGEAFAAKYTGFLSIFRSLPDIDGILANPEGAIVPTQVNVQYALCGALGARMNEKTATPILKYANRLPTEISVATVRDGLQRCKIMGISDAVKNTTEFVKWSKINASVIL